MNAPHTTEARLALSLRTPGLAEVAAPFVDARCLSDNHVQLVDILAHATGETDTTVLLLAALALSAQAPWCYLNPAERKPQLTPVRTP